MKAFRFSIEAVLTVRAREEQKASEHYARAAEALGLAESELAAARAELEGYLTTIEMKRRESFRPADHQLYLNATDYQKRYCDYLTAKVARAAEIAEQHRAELLRARKKHEVVKHLKEKQRLAHQRAVLADEELTIRDLILARHGRLGS